MINRLAKLREWCLRPFAPEFMPNTLTKQDRGVDNISRLIAGSVPRREMIKMIAVGLTATLIGKLPEPVYASALASPAAGGCCTGTRIDIQDPSSCAGTNRVARRFYVPGENGCGPANDPRSLIIPNSWGLMDLKPCCNAHDKCWGTCNSNRDTCDSSFLNCNTSLCSRYIGNAALQATCLAVGTAYWGFVHSPLGNDPYAAGQREGCQCCSKAATAGTECGSTCCPAGQFCSGGTCVLSCPSGTQGCGGVCVPSCPAGQSRDPVTCECKCADGRSPCEGDANCLGTVCCLPGSACNNGVCCTGSSVGCRRLDGCGGVYGICCSSTTQTCCSSPQGVVCIPIAYQCCRTEFASWGCHPNQVCGSIAGQCI